MDLRPLPSRVRPAIETPTIDAIVKRSSTVLIRREAVVEGVRLWLAVATWMTAVYGLCYFALPWLANAAGLYPGLGPLQYPISTTIGFGAALMVTLSAVAVGRPKVRVDAPHGVAVLGATVASLAVWAVLHSLLPGLARFPDMGILGFVTFFLMNVVESTLFGTMIAGLVRSIPRAFVLGGMFQVFFFTAVWFLQNLFPF
jgi:hypothetical protein